MIPVTEVFTSIQGEGKYVGVPSVFLRLWGCNLTCKGFSKDGKESGCDSVYSWDKKYSDSINRMSIMDCVNKLYDSMLDKTSFMDIQHLVITGGEPLLHQDSILELLEEILRDDIITHVTIETNGTILLKDKQRFSALLENNTNVKLLFSNSPKLSYVGEDKKYIKNLPVVLSSQELGNTVSDRTSSILKFVVKNPYDLDEVKAIINQLDSYYDTYVMPLGTTVEEIDSTMKKIVGDSLYYGFNISDRLHIRLFGDTRGT